VGHLDQESLGFRSPADSLSRRDAEEEASILRDELRRHNHLYYVEAEPQISDSEYDRLFKRLLDLEAAFPSLVTLDSPTQRVGASPRADLPTIPHASPMLSLDSTKEEEGLRRFHERMEKAIDGRVVYLVEPKLDGASLELVYEAGLLTRARTPTMPTISFLWHLHQPAYRTADGVAHAPWVLLHAGGAYATLARAIERSGGTGQIINIVPTLVEQLEAYRDDRVTDPVAEALVTPSHELSPGQRHIVIEWSQHISPRSWHVLRGSRSFGPGTPPISAPANCGIGRSSSSQSSHAWPVSPATSPRGA
jgi:hypothetical protein